MFNIADTELETEIQSNIYLGKTFTESLKQLTYWNLKHFFKYYDLKYRIFKLLIIKDSDLMKSGAVNPLLTKFLSLFLYFHLTDCIKTVFMAVAEENSARKL